MIYLAEIDDLDQLDWYVSAFYEQLKQGEDLQVHLIPSPRLIDSSGVASLVGDEIALFLSAGHGPFGEDAMAAARQWGLEDYFQTPVRELSGGWRKYLHLAARLSSLPDDCLPLLTCATQNLGPELVSSLAVNVTNYFSSAAFVEYDLEPLAAVLPSAIRQRLVADRELGFHCCNGNY